MKKLGFGLMRLPLTDPNDKKSIDIEQTKAMVDEFIARGYTYFDTAWMYHDFESERATKLALVERYPRESYTLATKLHSAFFENLEGCDKIFDEQLEKTGVTYFDYYLLHALDQDMYKKHTDIGTFPWLVAKKEAGLVKHIGFSFHGTPETLEQILTEHPEMEFVQLQLNYADWDSEGIRSHECYDIATKHGKYVTVMEPVKGGTLANLPKNVADYLKSVRPEWSQASWAIRFAANLPNVKFVLSGMSSLDQMKENLDTMESFEGFTEEEEKAVTHAVHLMNSAGQIACTGCSYCTSGCPMNIAIPQYFSLYNADLQEDPEKGWKPQIRYFNNIAKDFGKPEECIACGQCEAACPQHLPIIELLKTVEKHFKELSATMS